MDSSRFKRRQTNTTPNKNTLEGFQSRSAYSTQPIAARRLTQLPPRPVANTLALPAKPQPAAPSTEIITSVKTQPGVPAPIISEVPKLTDDPIEPPFQAPDQVATVFEVPEPPRRLNRIDMGLPGDISPEVPANTIIKHSKLKAVRKWSLRVVSVGLVLIIVAGGILFSQGYLKLHKVLKGGTKTAAALQKNVDPTLLKGEGSGRVNVLLLGRGGGDHDGPDLTDSMMVDSIDPINHTSTLLSLPRDLWVNVPDQGSMKINATWETGEFKYEGKIDPGSTDPNAIQAGFDQVDQSVESVLGITIDYNAIINFAAFKQAVATVGGVTVDVPTDLVDPTMAWQNGNNPVLAKAGIDTFNDNQALNYVRSRETTSDFARAERQRAVLEAIKEKVETLGTISNPLKLAGLINAFGNNVNTDISLSDADRLYSILKDIPDSKTNSISLDQDGSSQVTTGMIDGQSIVEPLAGLYNYSSIQKYVRSQLPDPYLAREDAKVLVLNGTTVPGLATTEAATLKSYGYNVVGVENAPSSGYVQSMVVDLNSTDKYTNHYLEQRFNLTSVDTLPDNTIQPNGADFVIIMGSDETPSN
jgi:LCP family protein required for cell wall assembly